MFLDESGYTQRPIASLKSDLGDRNLENNVGPNSPVQTAKKNQNTTSNILAWYVNGQFDEFLMIMMLEVIVELSNLIPPAIESYIIRQIRPFTDQKFSTNIKKQLKG